MARALHIVACALAFCALGAPAALADPPESRHDLGHARADPRGHRDGPEPITFLSTASGPQVVRSPPASPCRRTAPRSTCRPPRRHTLAATRRRSPARIDRACPARDATVLGGTPLAAGAPRKVAIVVITFSPAGVAPAYTDTQLPACSSTNSNSVSNYFAEQSYGRSRSPGSRARPATSTASRSPPTARAATATRRIPGLDDLGQPGSDRGRARALAYGTQATTTSSTSSTRTAAAAGPASATCPATRSTSTTPSRCRSSPTSSVTTSACTTPRRSAASRAARSWRSRARPAPARPTSTATRTT